MRRLSDSPGSHAFPDPRTWSTRVRLTATIVVAFLLLTAAVAAGTFLIVDRRLSTVTVTGVGVRETADESHPQTPSDRSPDGDRSGYTSVDVEGEREGGLSLSASAGNDGTRDLVLVSSLAPIVVFGVLSAALTWIIATNNRRRIDMVAGRIAARDADDPLSGRRIIDIPDRNDEANVIADAYNAMIGELNDAIARERRFIADASHELKNPLAATSAALEIPLDAGLFDERTRPFIVRALESNREGTRIVMRLLDLARVQHLDHARLADIDLADVAARILERERDGLRDLTVHADLEPAPLRADAQLVGQLASNLIVNAVQHNIPHGTVGIATGKRHDGATGTDFATLVVTNTGKDLSGIDPDELLVAFNRGPDGRTGGGGRVANHGLGLSIGDEIVRLHHGTMSLRPNPGGGLTVEVRLPVRP